MVDHPLEQTALMTIDEFMRLYDSEGPFEIIDGEHIPKMPSSSKHSYSTRAMLRALDGYSLAHQLGEVFSEATFILVDKPNWVRGSRIPDVMFFSAAKVAAFQTETPDWGDKPFILVPDLVVEVISPTDNYSDVDAKVEHYLDDDVQLVLVVDPMNKTVTVRGRDYYKKLKVGDILTVGDIMPGFELAVEKIFE